MKEDKYDTFRRHNLKDDKRFNSILINCEKFYLHYDYNSKEINIFIGQLGKNIL